MVPKNLSARGVENWDNCRVAAAWPGVKGLGRGGGSQSGGKGKEIHSHIYAAVKDMVFKRNHVSSSL